MKNFACMSVRWNRHPIFLKKWGSKKSCLCASKPGELFPASPGCLPFPPDISSFPPFSWPPSRSFCFCVGLGSPLFLQLSRRGKLFPYMLIIRDLVPVFPFKNILPKVQLLLYQTQLSPPHNALLHCNTNSDKLMEYKNFWCLQTPQPTWSVLRKVWYYFCAEKLMLISYRKGI